MSGRGVEREARAGVFSLVAVGLSAALHTVVSGTEPAPLAVLAGVGLTWIGAVLLARRERGFVLIAAAMLTAQGGLHALFSLLSPHCGHTMTGTPFPMVLVHVVAGLLAAAWLRAGEAAWALLGRLTRRPFAGLSFFLALFRVCVPVAGPTPQRPIAVWMPLHDARWRHILARRGPPLRSA